MKVKVFVTLKEGVLDPQGKAVGQALGRLGYDEVTEVRQGKFFELSLADGKSEDATARIAQMCEKLLVNTVIEDYSFEIIN